MASLVACSNDDTVAVSYKAYNYTPTSIVSVAINGEGGILNASAYGGGGGEVCCVVLPAEWRPGLKATNKWEEDGDWLKDDKGNIVIRDGDKIYVPKPSKEKTIDIPKYEAKGQMGQFRLHFFPNDVVKVAVLPYGPGHAGYPYPYPKDPTEKDSFLAIIPGVNMYHEARKAGVPLTAWPQLDLALQQALTPAASVTKDFNAYLHAASIGAGSVEQLGRRHMGLHFSYRFKHLSSYDYFLTAPYRNSTRVDQGYLYTTQRTFYMQLAKLRDLVSQQDPQFAKTWSFQRNYGSYLDKASSTWDELRASPSTMSTALNMAWKSTLPGLIWGQAKGIFEAKQAKTSFDFALEVAQSIHVESVTPEIEAFFERYIHDSEAGFMALDMNEYAYNGIGIVKFRTVYKGNG